MIATALTVIASISSLAMVAPWAFDLPALQGLGFDGRPVWPLTGIGYSALSIAFTCALLGLRRTAIALWGFTVLLGGVSLFQWMSGIDLGIDTALFHDKVVQFDADKPGRPGPNPSTIFLLLSFGGWVALSQAPRLSPVRGVVTAATFTVSATVAVMILLVWPSSADHSLANLGAPGIVTAIALALAFIVHHSDPLWFRLVAVQRKDWQVLRILLPIAIALPVVPSLMEALLQRYDLFSDITREIVVVVGNVMIVAIVLYWAVTRIDRGRSEVIELSQAMEQTTVVLTDLDGRISYWSQGCEQLYGWTAAEATGRRKYALLRSRCEAPGFGAPRPADTENILLVERCRDGREVSVIERAHKVDSPGRAPVLVLSITDVTQGIAAAQALAESEERLAMAVAVHELGILEWDVASGRIDWSPGTEQRLGLATGSMRDFEAWRRIVDPADLQQILDSIARAVQTRADRFNWRYRFRLPNGAQRTVEGSSRTFYDAEGNLVRTLGVILDVSEQEERECALRRREAQLRSILETVPDAMVVLNESGVIQQFSAAAEALWGYRAADVVGQNGAMLIPADSRPEKLEQLSTFVRTDEELVGRVLKCDAETADGRRIPIEGRIGIAHVDDELLLTIFVHDLSHQLATEERMSELNAEIAHVSRQSAMSELAADLAHELNQPLSATSNFLAAARILLDRGEAVERVTDLLRMGSEQTQRAGEIIRRMRAFMARGEVEIRAESLERTVRDAAELVMVGTGQFQIRVIYQLDPNVRHVFADRIQVQQVLVNLIRNSMEALRQIPRAEREITIGSRPAPDNMVEVEVSDNGPGIPAAVLEQMFSRFTTTKGPSGGMGIGLSISKRIIEAHGGTLSAGNRPQGGAIFRFTLPVVEEDE
ncbi:PAS domain S-box protein [Sphingomonas sp. CJ20]